MPENTKSNLIIRIGYVESVKDEYGSGRIKVGFLGDTSSKSHYAYPLLPYMVHIKPKKEEAVLVLCPDTITNKSNLFYIGPLIHQPQYVNFDKFENATSILKGGNQATLASVEKDAETDGAFPKENEIALLGRKDTDLILGDNDVRLRCGVHLTDKNNGLKSIFNRQTPTFVKLATHDKPLSNKTNTTATIVSENINLISTVGTPEFTVTNSNGSISDEDMNKIIETAHQLPYGDVLLDFIKLFLKTFNNHKHPYSYCKPVKDDNYNALQEFNLNSLLSKHVKIN